MTQLHPFETWPPSIRIKDASAKQGRPIPVKIMLDRGRARLVHADVQETFRSHFCTFRKGLEIYTDRLGCRKSTRTGNARVEKKSLTPMQPAASVTRVVIYFARRCLRAVG